MFDLQDKANPLATVLSAAMLLRYGLGEKDAANTIENAVMETLNKDFRTGDIFSTGKVHTIRICVVIHLSLSSISSL